MKAGLNNLTYKDFVEILDTSHKTYKELPNRVAISNQELESNDFPKVALIMATLRVLTKKGLIQGNVDLEMGRGIGISGAKALGEPE